MGSLGRYGHCRLATRNLTHLSLLGREGGGEQGWGGVGESAASEVQPSEQKGVPLSAGRRWFLEDGGGPRRPLFPPLRPAQGPATWVPPDT